MILFSTTTKLCSLLSGFFQHESGQGLFWWSQHHRLPDHQPRQPHRPAVPPALGAPGWKRIPRSQKHSAEGQWGEAADAAVAFLFNIFKGCRRYSSSEFQGSNLASIRENMSVRIISGIQFVSLVLHEQRSVVTLLWRQLSVMLGLCDVTGASLGFLLAFDSVHISTHPRCHPRDRGGLPVSSAATSGRVT